MTAEKPRPTYFWKDVISPDMLFVREQNDDGTLGGVRLFNAPSRRVQHWHAQTKAMLACGLSIPIPLEHGDERAMDERSLEAQRLLFNTGWVVDCRMKDGALQHRLRIDKPEVAKGLRDGTIKMISPLIEPSFMDGRGRVWNDVIVHDALTNKAVQQPQGAFRVAASAKSGTIPALPDNFRGIVCRATALSVPAKGGSMAGTVPEDDDDGKGEGDDTKLDIGGSGGAGTAAKQPDTSLPIGMDRVVSPQLVESLARHNLFVPADCKLSMLEDMLMVSLNTSAMAQGLLDTGSTDDNLDGEQIDLSDDDDQFVEATDEGEDDDDPNNPRKKKDQMKEEQLTVPLSTPRGGIIGDPAISKYAGARKQAGTPTKDKAESVKLSIALQRNAFTGFRREMVAKLDELRDNGQIMPVDHVELVNQVNAAKLGINPDGSVTEGHGIALSIRTYSKIPKGTFWTDAERTSNLTEHRMPSSMLPANDMTQDEAVSIVDDAFGPRRK